MSGDTDTSGDTKHLSVHFNYLHNHQKLWILHSDLCHNLDKSHGLYIPILVICPRDQQGTRGLGAG